MKIIFLILIPLSLTAHASTKDVLAKVTLIKGNATILYPGTKEAISLKLNSPVYNDSSIVTKPRSIIRLRYKDKSIVTIKPKSKIIVGRSQNKNKSISVIGLLKGRIRSYVKKKEGNKEIKMKIKTRSAVMGVRGTEFEAIHYPNTNRSTLLTYNGEVEIQKQNNDYKKENSVFVSAGFVSSVTEEQMTPLTKEKLNTQQFEILKDTDPLNVAEQSKTDKQTKKTGWILDSKTGIISKSNSVLKGKGRFDKTTGDYISPLELKDNINSNFKYQLSLAYLAEVYDFTGNKVDLSGETHSNLATQLGVDLFYKTDKLSEYYLSPRIKYSKFDDPATTIHKDSKTIFTKLLLGYKYPFSNILKLITEFGLQDQLVINIYNENSSSTYYSSLKTVLVPRFSFGMEYLLDKINITAMIIQKFGGGKNSQRVNKAIAYHLGAHYQMTNYNLFAKYLSEEIKSYYTNSIHQQISLGIGYSF